MDDGRTKKYVNHHPRRSKEIVKWFRRTIILGIIMKCVIIMVECRFKKIEMYLI